MHCFQAGRATEKRMSISCACVYNCVCTVPKSKRLELQSMWSGSAALYGVAVQQTAPEIAARPYGVPPTGPRAAASGEGAGLVVGHPVLPRTTTASLFFIPKSGFVEANESSVCRMVCLLEE